jgi:hypothetical protein
VEPRKGGEALRPARAMRIALVEKKTVKKISWADIRKMSGEEYARALKDTGLGPQIEAQLRDL